jgi:hypothetical protein
MQWLTEQLKNNIEKVKIDMFSEPKDRKTILIDTLNATESTDAEKNLNRRD